MGSGHRFLYFGRSSIRSTSDSQSSQLPSNTATRSILTYDMPAPYDPIELDRMMDAAMPLVPEGLKIPSNEVIAKMKEMKVFDRSGGIQAIEANIGLRLNEWKDQGGLENPGVSYLYVNALGLLNRELRQLKETERKASAQASKDGDSKDGAGDSEHGSGSGVPDTSVESGAPTDAFTGTTGKQPDQTFGSSNA